MIANIPLRSTIKKAVRKPSAVIGRKKKGEVFTKVEKASALGTFGLVVANEALEGVGEEEEFQAFLKRNNKAEAIDKAGEKVDPYTSCIRRCKDSWESDMMTGRFDMKFKQSIENFCRIVADEELAKNPEEKKRQMREHYEPIIGHHKRKMA